VSTHGVELVGTIPVAISFHATKSFGVGEGGCVVTTDQELGVRVTQALNFGFYGSRSCRSASTNGKLSEYHAAVGLAELDGWPQKRRMLQDTADRYQREMTRANLADRLHADLEAASCYVLFTCKSAVEASRVQASLRRASIEFRLWYGEGLLKEPYFRALPHGDLTTTDSIAPRVIGLPVAPDLTDATVRRIVSALRRGVSGRR
jgi:dTDP-4-amino-4,6-dideoxygalactose transaminase